LATIVASAAETLDYSTADDELKVVLLDSSEKESFLAVQADAMGRLFVGGREALFVYEPKAEGGYAPRQELVRFPDHTWVYDIALRGNDVFVLTVSALYVIPDVVTKRADLKPQRLIWGVPMGHVHQCFHGLAWGPEGDLYISMGDPLWYYGDFNRPDHWGHWTFFSQPNGTRTPYNGVGGVFRCRPDGSRFQIVSRGLRNSCGLVFDAHWNLFTNDNDHEGMPAMYVPGRLLHVTPYSYFSWPRGWLVSKTPERADMLQTMSDKLGRYVPVGQAYYNDTFLPEKYRNNLLVARWCTRAVTRYPLAPRGASFQTEEQPLLIGRDMARPVGVGVGRGGRVFTTIAYMAQNEGSPVYRSDLAMITRKDDPAAAPFESYDVTKADEQRLWTELSNPSWSRRYLAHNEVQRRGDLSQTAAELLRLSSANDPSREHLIWLAAAANDREVGQDILTLAEKGTDGERLQAVRALAEYRNLGATQDEFVRALSDANPQVQLAGLHGLFVDRDVIPEAVITGPARSKDTYLRQTAALLLADAAPFDTLEEMCRSSDTATRLAGVLAAGFRLTIPWPTEAIPENLKLDKLRDEAAYVIQYADEKIDLREYGRIGNYTVADHWKQSTHTVEQVRLFNLLMQMLADTDEQVRLQAVHFLSVLNDPRSEPEVAKVVAANEERRLAIAPIKNVTQAWLLGPLDDGDQGFARMHPVEEGVIDLTKTYDSPGGTRSWQLAKTDRQFRFSKIVGQVDNSSCYVYFRIESGSRQRAHLSLGSDDGIKVWQNGQLVWTNDVSRAALPFSDQVTIQLEPGSNDILIRVRNVSGESSLFASYRALNEVAIVLPEKVDIAGLAERLASAGKGANSVPAEFLTIDWIKAANEGNIDQGRKLFEAAGCAKCHSTKADAALAGGPSLADAAKRFTIPYLVESILLPNKQISPVFRATQVQSADGKVLTGLLVGETAEKIELLLPDTKRVSIEKSEIEARALQDLSPMPQGVVKQPGELRDLLAYLLSGKP
jgi:putative heme-binding domain-containing protein